MTLEIPTCHAQIRVGDRISMEVPDRRVWTRFKHWLLRRDQPIVRQELCVMYSLSSEEHVGRLMDALKPSKECQR